MIERVQLRTAGDARVDVAMLAAEFPSVVIDGRIAPRARGPRLADGPDSPADSPAEALADSSAEAQAEPPAKALIEIGIDAGTWMDMAARLIALDERVAASAEAGPVCLVIELGAAGDRTARVLSVLTRYQRFAPRRNSASRSRAFDAALLRHRSLHDFRKPLVRADYDHALDAWQWLLRLRPEADLAPQLAALFHDVERLVSEADARVEHRASDYLAFKQTHARRGAHMALTALDGCGLPEPQVLRALELVASHEQPGANEDLALLNDADALSFLSLNSPAFMDYFGPGHTRKKALFTLRRLSAAGRARLGAIGLRPDVARIVEDAARTIAGEVPAGAPSAIVATLGLA